MGRLAAISIAIAAMACVGAGVQAAPDPAAAVLKLPYRSLTAQTDGVLEELVLDLINRERRAAGVRPLAASTPLRTIARDHGRELFARGVLSHQAKDGRGVRKRFERAGIPFRIAGENVAYAEDIRTAHRELMDSSGHRRNILSPAFRRVGIGVLNAGEAGVVVVQNFSD
ncbi:MAG: CAP domain-containing protein [bacterium]